MSSVFQITRRHRILFGFPGKITKEYAHRKELTVAKIFSIAELANGPKKREVFDEIIKFTEKNKITNILWEKADRLT